MMIHVQVMAQRQVGRTSDRPPESETRMKQCRFCHKTMVRRSIGRHVKTCHPGMYDPNIDHSVLDVTDSSLIILDQPEGPGSSSTPQPGDQSKGQRYMKLTK